MADGFIGEVRLFAFNFAPMSWAFCYGQQMAVVQNQALYSIIGNKYGGTTNQTFNLPALQGTVPLGIGAGPGLTNRLWTDKTTGSNSVTLTPAQVAVHTHTVTAKFVGQAAGSANMTASPATTNDSWLSRAASITTSGSTTTNLPIPNFTTNATPDTTFPVQTISAVGGAANNNNAVDSHENRQPYLAVNFCICLDGVYPVRD